MPAPNKTEENKEKKHDGVDLGKVFATGFFLAFGAATFSGLVWLGRSVIENRKARFKDDEDVELLGADELGEVS